MCIRDRQQGASSKTPRSKQESCKPPACQTTKKAVTTKPRRAHPRSGRRSAQRATGVLIGTGSPQTSGRQASNRSNSRTVLLYACKRTSQQAC
eukprot:7140803-Prorocentrum_lima.AAC.1